MGTRQRSGAVIAVTAIVVHGGLTSVVRSKNVFVAVRKRSRLDAGDQDSRLRAADDCPAVGHHAGHGVCPAGGDNDSRGTGVLPPHGGAVWKLHDAGQSFLLQGPGTNKHGSSPGAHGRAYSSAHNCCDTAGRFASNIARGDSALPPFVSSCTTSRTVSRL